METKRMEELYQSIANVIIETIPDEWNKIYAYSEVREGYSQVYFYYYSTNKSQLIYSLDIVDIFKVDKKIFKTLKHEMYSYFESLWREFKNQEHEQWTYLTFILDSNGKMKIDYGYDDVSEINPVEKKGNWEKKYLEVK